MHEFQHMKHPQQYKNNNHLIHAQSLYHINLPEIKHQVYPRRNTDTIQKYLKADQPLIMSVTKHAGSLWKL